MKLLSSGIPTESLSIFILIFQSRKENLSVGVNNTKTRHNDANQKHDNVLERRNIGGERKENYYQMV